MKETERVTGESEATPAVERKETDMLPGDNPQFAANRALMVARQLQSRDITCPQVLAAMGAVPRHLFVPDNLQATAYADHPLPIGENQTISQPYIVAYMTQAMEVKPGQRILEVGTGSGYQAAVLAQMGATVYSIEIVSVLGERSSALLERLGYAVTVVIGDGYDGLVDEAPFDGIMVTAAPERIPTPLVEQLADGGRLVIPVGAGFQSLQVYTKSNGQLQLLQTLPVRFVPMTGKAQNP